MKTATIRAWSWVHTWSGLVATAFLLMLCVTGLPLVFTHEIEEALLDRPWTPANAANTVALEDWTRFDAGVRYAFEAGGKPVTLRARVENLADEDHWVAVGGYPGANYLTLGAPRTLRLSISTDF